MEHLDAFMIEYRCNLQIIRWLRATTKWEEGSRGYLDPLRWVDMVGSVYRNKSWICHAVGGKSSPVRFIGRHLTPTIWSKFIQLIRIFSNAIVAILQTLLPTKPAGLLWPKAVKGKPRKKIGALPRKKVPQLAHCEIPNYLLEAMCGFNSWSILTHCWSGVWNCLWTWAGAKPSKHIVVGRWTATVVPCKMRR